MRSFLASAALACGLAFAQAPSKTSDAATKSAPPKQASKQAPSTAKAATKAAPTKAATAKTASAKSTTGKSTSAAKSTTTGKSATAAKSTTASKTASKAPPRRVVQTQPTQDRYREIQQALADRGYFDGEVDGNWGPQSIESLKHFQRDQNLDDDGKIGSMSLIKLGLGPQRAYVQPSAPTEATPTPSAPAAEPPQ